MMKKKKRNWELKAQVLKSQNREGNKHFVINFEDFLLHL